MEDKAFRKLCSKTDYNKYNEIKKAIYYSTIGITSTNILLSQYQIENIPMILLMGSGIVASLKMACSHGEDYTKDIKEIEYLYEKFIMNFNVLNEIFDFKDPIEIYTMFNYLVRKGYLSKDKEIDFSTEKGQDIKNLIGINVITGNAVCRHLATMLTDILNDYDIEADNLVLYYSKYIKIKKENEISEIKIEDTLIKRLIGNHLITYAVKDEKNYFLDPMQRKIYRISENDVDILYYKNHEIPIKLNTISLIDGKDKCLKIKENLLQKYPSISKEEEKKVAKKTLNICRKHTDIFEQFYNENNELYNDISNKVLKIKKNN